MWRANGEFPGRSAVLRARFRGLCRAVFRLWFAHHLVGSRRLAFLTLEALQHPLAHEGRGLNSSPVGQLLECGSREGCWGEPRASPRSATETRATIRSNVSSRSRCQCSRPFQPGRVREARVHGLRFRFRQCVCGEAGPGPRQRIAPTECATDQASCCAPSR
jgi:hypothetical protein